MNSSNDNYELYARELSTAHSRTGFPRRAGAVVRSWPSVVYLVHRLKRRRGPLTLMHPQREPSGKLGPDSPIVSATGRFPRF